jgi:hypothetical protein
VDKCGYLNLSAVYCPPRHTITESMFTQLFEHLGNRFVIGGDWNSKHTHWGSRLITTRGRQLKTSIAQNNLIALSASGPTYWPTDPNKIPDLLDFFIAKGISRLYFKVESCADSSSDHTPVILTISTLVIYNEPPDTLYNIRTDWGSFREYIDSKIELKKALKTTEDIDSATKYITTLIQEGCWRNTPVMERPDKNENQPLNIKYKVLEKRRLRRVWHQSRLRDDKVRLDRASRELKRNHTKMAR